jgi:hypothetical protein
MALACAALACLGQLFCALGRNTLPHVRFPAQNIVFAAASAVNVAGDAATNTSAVRTPRPNPSPVDARTRSKARFMAGAGLVVLSLLILAAGLALLRAFRQR